MCIRYANPFPLHEAFPLHVAFGKDTHWSYRESRKELAKQDENT
jgi:hypothetical protein